MRSVLAALLMLTLPVLADEPDLVGTWNGTIMTVGTRLQSTYSPITGVSVTTVPDIQITPSPFGPLVLDADGTYAMPALDLSGDWTVDGSALVLTGGLEKAAAHFERLETGPVLVIDLPLAEGEVQTVTFSRAP
jgi:hypothetical protein